ncbi:MAG TPA: hypothetical protein VF691_12270 [Cytophagaceae bacterium]|jgi:hypothetical protein
MENAKKMMIVKHHQKYDYHEVMKLHRFHELKSDPSNYFLYENGFVMPEGVTPCWYVNEMEKASSISQKKRFCDDFVTDIYFRLDKRIDSDFLEGFIGSNRDEYSYYRELDPTVTFFTDYQNRRPIYFTLDKINLYKVMEIYPGNPLKFILKRIDNLSSSKPNQAFMIMPFHTEELDVLYFQHIRSFLEKTFGMNIHRADDFRDNDVIVDTIYRSIEESEIIIADTTHDNKNAFYELGYASALGKEIITIQNLKAQKLFFDRAHIRTIMYDLDDIESFQFNLEATIKSIRSRL